MLSWTGCVKYDDDIAALNDRIDSLESVTIADLESQVATLESSIAAAQQLIADNQAELESLIEDMEAEIVELQAQLDAAEDDLAALEERVADLESQVEQLEKDVAAAQAAADAAQAAADAAQAAADDAQDAADAAQATANKATTDAAAAQAAADAAQQDADDAQDAADAAQTAADVAQAEVDALEIELATLKTEIAATYATIATVELLEVRIAQLESDIDDIKTSIADLEDMDDKLQDLIDANSDLISANFTNIAANADAIAALESDLTVLATELGDRITALETLTANLEERADGFDESIEDINEALTELNDVTIPGIQENITNLQSDLDTLEGEVGELEGKVGANTDDIAALKERMDTAEGKIEAAEGRLDDIEAELLLVWAEFETIREEFAAADQALYEKLSGEFATAIAKLRTGLEGWVGEQLATYWSTCFDTTGADADAFIAAMKELLTSAACNDWFVNQSELSDLNDIVTQLRNEFDALESEYDAYVAANDLAIQALKDEISEINDLIAGLRSDVTVLQSEVASLLAQIQSISYVPTSISFLEYAGTYNFAFDVKDDETKEVSEVLIPLTLDNTYTISYDVRPAATAEAVVAAFAAYPEDMYMMFENVTRATEAVDVVDVTLNEKEGRIDVAFSVDFDENMLNDKALAVAFGIQIDGLEVETEEGETETMEIYVDIMSDYAAMVDANADNDDFTDNNIKFVVDYTYETFDIEFDCEDATELFSEVGYHFEFGGVEYATAADLQKELGVDITALDETIALTLVKAACYDKDDVYYKDGLNIQILQDEAGDDIMASLVEPGATGCAYQYAIATASYTFTYDGTEYTVDPIYTKVTIKPEQTIWAATSTTVWNSEIEYYVGYEVETSNFFWPGNQGGGNQGGGSQGGGSQGGSGDGDDDDTPTYTTEYVYEMWITLDKYEVTYGNTTVSIADVLAGAADDATVSFTIESATDGDVDFTGIEYIVSNTANFNANDQKLFLRLTEDGFRSIFGNGDGNGNTIELKLTTKLTEDGLDLHEYVINLTANFDAYLAAMNVNRNVEFTYDSANPDAAMTYEVMTNYLTNYSTYFTTTSDAYSSEFVNLVANATATSSVSTAGVATTGAASTITLPASGVNCNYALSLDKADFVNSAQSYEYTHAVSFWEDNNMPYGVALTANIGATVDFTSAFAGVVRNYEYFGYDYDGFEVTADQIGIMGQYIDASGNYISDATVKEGTDAESFGFNRIDLDAIFRGYYIDATGATVEYPVNTTGFEWTFSYDSSYYSLNRCWISSGNEFTFISPETYTTIDAVSASYQDVELEGVFDNFFTNGNTFTVIIPDAQRPISYENESLTIEEPKEVIYNDIDTEVFYVTEELSLVDRLGVDIFAASDAGTTIWSSNDYYVGTSYDVYTHNFNASYLNPSVTFGSMTVKYATDSISSVELGDYESIVSFDKNTGAVTVTNTGKMLNVDYKVTVPVTIYTPLYLNSAEYVFYVRGNGSVATE